MANRNGKEETHETNNHNGANIATAHDWEEDKRLTNDFFDIDGSNNFFWRAHRLTVLIVFTCILIYVSMFEDVKIDIEFNTKRGLVAVILTFVLFGVTHTPDGPFRRPHPAFWRLILCLSIVYELALVFLLFQSVDDARQLLKNIDDSLGEPLPEKDYGGNCRLYDKENPEDPFHNVWDKMDGFVVVHFVGWWFKTLVIRDYWLCMVISIMFEILEYTLEHQLPNFSECWWDHWIMDALVCNWLGIYLGMKTLRYLKMKPYHWRSMWNIPTYRGKLTRLLRQFTPHSWMDFAWKPTSSLGRWVGMLIVTAIFLLAELNTFYLKFVLWIPPPHILCLGRLVFFVFMGASAMRETFQYMDDPHCTKFGHQSFMILAVIITELLITLKFDWDTITKPLPPHVLLFWIVGATGLTLWTVWHFYLQRLLSPTEPEVLGQSSGVIDHGKAAQHDQNFNMSSPERQLRSRKRREMHLTH